MADGTLLHVQGGQKLFLVGRPATHDLSLQFFCWDLPSQTLISRSYNHPMTRYTPLFSVTVAGQPCMFCGGHSGLKYSMNVLNSDGQPMGLFGASTRVAFGRESNHLAMLRSDNSGWDRWTGSEYVPWMPIPAQEIRYGYFLWRWRNQTPERVGEVLLDEELSFWDVKAFIVSTLEVKLILSDGRFRTGAIVVDS